MTDQEAEQEIRAQLEPGENLLWSGAPREGVFLRRRDAFVIPASIVGILGAVFFLSASLANDSPAVFVAGGILMVVVGGCLLAARLPMEAKIRARSAYGLTDRRVIMIGGIPHRVRSILLHELPGVSLQAESDGLGTVWFVPDDPLSRLDHWPFKTGVWAPMSYQCFECIESAEEVLRLVREAEARAWAEIRRRSKPPRDP